MKRYISLTLIIMILNITSGFGATPSKPDFAYPKSVAQNSLKDLKSALKNNDGPGIVRATLNYGLAQTAINRKYSINDFSKKVDEIKLEVRDETTLAMLDLVVADATNSDELALTTFRKYKTILRPTATVDWQTVIDVDSQFTPTLYDFALSAFDCLSDKEDLIAEAIDFHSNNPYPATYYSLLNKFEFDDILSVCNKFKNQNVEAYALSKLAECSSTIEQRTLAYQLCSESKSSFAEVLSETKAYLTQPSAKATGQTIIKLNNPYILKIESTCANDVIIIVEMTEPHERIVQEIPLHFEGEGVFQLEKELQLSFPDYGVYKISVVIDKHDNNQHQNSSFGVTVTDFLMSGQSYGNQTQTFALDAINGKLQKDVEIIVNNREIIGKRGNDVYSPTIYKQVAQNVTEISGGNIYTDRAIYRPGDKLKFAATLYKVTTEGRMPKINSNAKVILYNANYTEIDSLNLKTDKFGRLFGELNIPENDLTGYYRIVIPQYTQEYILVNDYKIPTFDVELTARRIDETTVELNGKAIGYNGFPIGGADVAIKVKELPQWVWLRSFRNEGEQSIFADTIQTLPDGTFFTMVSIPSDKNVSASAIVSANNGESHDAYCFIPAFPYFICADIPKIVNAETLPTISILNSEGVSVDRSYSLTLTSINTKKTFKPNPDWSNVPSGEYKALITSDGAKELLSDNFILYRLTDKNPPIETGLFIPYNEVYSDDKLMIGTSFDDSNILMTIWTENIIIKQEWLSPKKGNFFLDIELPKSINEAKITFITLRNYKFHEKTINIRRKNIPDFLKIEIESMRDKIAPGDNETWTIKVTDNLGNRTRSAVILDVYSRALDAINAHNLDFRVLSGNHIGNNLRYSYNRLNIFNARAQIYTPEPDTFDLIPPSFELYDQSWPFSRHFPYLGCAPRSSMNELAYSTTGLSLDAADDIEESTEYNGIVESSNSDIDNSNIRMPELPVALWEPTLTTDSTGQLNVKFIAPNATTTWAVKALAYNKSLLSGKFSAEIISSKPVMVQPNWPRFLRIGDKIQLRSSILNNTDAATDIKAKIELYNPTNNVVIKSQDFAMTIEAMRSDIIAMEFTVPEAALLGVRIKATSDNFTDGEQTILSILPNNLAINSAKPLFIPADTSTTTIDVPNSAVLSLTANAVWECLISLPGLQVSESKSAFAAVNALFSAATAKGLLRQHPAISKALSIWQTNDSSLISNLHKNEDLKIALLNSTPFVNAAESETEQRARLLLLLDKSQIDKTIADATHNLAKLVRNGGLTWTDNCTEPSFWVTQRVITTLAQLKRIGYLPKNERLEKLIANAIKYLDDEVARTYAKDKNTLFVDYALLRSQFPEIHQPSPTKRAVAATVQHLVSNWRNYSLPEIAKAAIILNENNYQTTAQNLIESLRQHEVWNNDEINPNYILAFHSVQPNCPEVDMLRSTYVSRKHSMDWGKGLATSDLIAAIINTGSHWLVPAANELSISINGKQLEIDKNNIMGEYRLSLPEGGKIEINKGQFPAWGGVFIKSNDSIKAIDANCTDDVKITRSIEGEMKVGSKITITLTIESNREVDYVIVRQPRCAAFEPVDQLPSNLWLGYLTAYREPCKTETNWFFNRIAEGKTIITESYYVTAQGSFALAPAEIQSQYSPEFKANSEGKEITISE